MKTDIADQVSNIFATIDRYTQAFQSATLVPIAFHSLNRQSEDRNFKAKPRSSR
jgi:hypothetical protein